MESERRKPQPVTYLCQGRGNPFDIPPDGGLSVWPLPNPPPKELRAPPNVALPPDSIHDGNGHVENYPPRPAPVQPALPQNGSGHTRYSVTEPLRAEVARTIAVPDRQSGPAPSTDIGFSKPAEAKHHQVNAAANLTRIPAAPVYQAGPAPATGPSPSQPAEAEPRPVNTAADLARTPTGPVPQTGAAPSAGPRLSQPAEPEPRPVSIATEVAMTPAALVHQTEPASATGRGPSQPVETEPHPVNVAANIAGTPTGAETQTEAAPSADPRPSQHAEARPRPTSFAAKTQINVNNGRVPFFDDRKVSWFEGKSRTTSLLRYCADQVRIYSYATQSRLSRPADMSSKVALAVFMCTRVRNSHGGKLYMYSRRTLWRLLSVPEISYAERRQSPLAGQLCRVVLFKGGTMLEEERRLRFQNISQRIIGAKEEAYIMAMAYEQRFVAICQALERLGARVVAKVEYRPAFSAPEITADCIQVSLQSSDDEVLRFEDWQHLLDCIRRGQYAERLWSPYTHRD